MKKWTKICLCIAGLTAMIAADLLWEGIPEMTILKELRIPRIATAMLAGAALALSGAQMQSIFRNPLADPHIMGVSSGAALGAAIATMSGGQTEGITVVTAAFVGAAVASAVILAVSRNVRSTATLLIFGVMLGFIVTAIVTILQFRSDAESLKIFYSWSAGSFSNTTWKEVGIMFLTLAGGYIIAFRNRKGLDIILFGDEFAELSGADPARIRLTALLSCCLMTAAVTAFCGPLGFVGIVSPHIARAVLGTAAHKSILPVSILFGCSIGLLADFISYTAPAPIPVASAMALVGIPIILYILVRRPSL